MMSIPGAGSAEIPRARRQSLSPSSSSREPGDGTGLARHPQVEATHRLATRPTRYQDTCNTIRRSKPETTGGHQPDDRHTRVGDVLRRAYDDALSEPVPDVFAELLRKLT